MANEPQSFHIPLELKTILKSLRMRFGMIIGLVVLSALLGVSAALLLGDKQYEATTVLYYAPIESYVSDSFRIYQSVGSGTELTYDQGTGLMENPNTTDLVDYVNMVKIVTNLEELRRRLSLQSTLEELGSSISVDTAYDSSLMFISSRSDNARDAALKANTLRDIFLENSNAMIDQSIESKIADLTLQYETTAQDLAVAQQAFTEFVRTHEIKEIGTEAVQYTSELLTLEATIARAENLIETAQAKVDRIKEELAVQQELSKRQMTNQLEQLVSEGLTSDEVANRIRLLEQKITAMQAAKTNPIEESRLKSALAIAENGYVRGTVSRAEFERATYEFELFLAQKETDEELDQLQQQLGELLSSRISTTSQAQTENTYMLNLQTRLLESELQLIEAKAEYQNSHARYQELQKKYVDLPLLTQEYTRLGGNLAALEAANQGLSKVLKQYSLIKDQSHTDFSVVSEASEPLYPRESNRRLIALAVTVLCFLLGFTVLLVLIAVDMRIKSAGDAKQKLLVPILQTISFLRNKVKLLPSGDGESAHIEAYRILCRPLRQAYPQRGATFLVTSTTEGEGKSTTALNLAAVFGRQDERVLLIDAQIRKSEELSPFAPFLLDEDPTVGDGLGEYLSFKVFDHQQIISSSKLSGVDMIVRRGEAVIPDLLQSARMRELMAALKEQYSVIIIEGPPVQDCVDSDILASYSDSILFVTACDSLKPDVIQRAIKRMQHTSANFEGIVLTKVRQVYLD